MKTLVNELESRNGELEEKFSEVNKPLIDEFKNIHK